MKIVNYFQRFKSLPLSTKKILGLGVVVALFIALPLFIWALVTQTYKVQEKAATGEPGVCTVTNNTIRLTPYGSANSTCHDLRMAIEAASPTERTVIYIQHGQYDIYSQNTTDPLITINKPITFVGILSEQGIKPQLRFMAGHVSPIGILITKQRSYTDRQQVLDDIVKFENLNLESNLGNEAMLIKAEDRILALTNSELYYYASGGVNSNSSLLFIEQLESYGFPANNVRIEHSTVAASQNGFAIKTNLKDETFGLYIDRSTIGRVETRGPLNAPRMPSVWIQNSTNYQGMQFMNNQIDIKYNLIYGGIGLHANHSKGQIIHNSILYSKDYGLTTTGDYYSSISNNIVMNSTRVGAYITLWPGETVSEFKYNNIYGNNPNYGFADNNPPLLSDRTGTDGNISASPQFGNDYCLLPGSPSLYGNPANGEFMGHKGPCGSTPPPSQTPRPSCIPIPLCADQEPRCEVYLPPGAYFCPTPTPSSRVTVITPNGGEILNVGQNYTIKWRGPGRRSYLIYLTNSLGETSLIDAASASATTYNWRVNSPIMSRTNLHKIRITETGQNPLSDSSNNYFRIVRPTSPTPSPTPTGKPEHCKNPFTINLAPDARWGFPGEPVRYNIRVSHNNAEDCGSYTVHMIVDKPSNWEANFATQTFVLHPNHTYDTHLDVTSATSNYVLGENILPIRISTEEVGPMGSTQVVYNVITSATPTPSPTSTPAVGDVNGDGRVNIIDIGIIVDNYRTSPPANPAADVNGDGIVNIIDIGIVVDNYQID
jgi:hypothetical protein